MLSSLITNNHLLAFIASKGRQLTLPHVCAAAGRKLQQFTSSNYASAPAEGPDINAQFASESAITPAPGPSATQTDSVQVPFAKSSSETDAVEMF